VITDAFATTGPTLTAGDINNPGVLDVGETWTYTATYTVTQNDINAGTDLVNIAVVDTDQTEPAQDDATTQVTRTSTFTITKDVDLATISAPGTLNYTITLVNTGNTSLTNVVITDAFATTGPTLTAGDINNPGVLDVGETWTYTLLILLLRMTSMLVQTWSTLLLLILTRLNLLRTMLLLR